MKKINIVLRWFCLFVGIWGATIAILTLKNGGNWIFPAINMFLAGINVSYFFLDLFYSRLYRYDEELIALQNNIIKQMNDDMDGVLANLKGLSAQTVDLANMTGGSTSSPTVPVILKTQKRVSKKPASTGVGRKTRGPRKQK